MADGMELKEPLLPYSADQQGHGQQPPPRSRAKGGANVHATSDLHHDYQAGTETSQDSPPNSPPGARPGMVFRNVGGMDAFFERFYHYFRYRGWVNILLSLIFDMFKVLMLFLLIVFVALCVDFPALSRMVTVDEECRGASSIFGTDCQGNTPIHFDRLTNLNADVVAVLVVFCLVWALFLILRLRRLRGLLQMRDFFENVLQISSAELQTISWSDLENKLIQAFRQHKFDFKKHADVLDGWIAKCVIMRKANGLTRLYSSILADALSVPSLSCSTVKVHYLPRILHEALSHLIDSTIFKNVNGVACLRSEVTLEEYEIPAQHLRWWMRVIGLGMLVFSPFLLLYNAADFCFRYSDLLRNSPGTFAVRQWTHYATWYFRCDNELDHYCKRRLHDAYKPTKRYLDSFASYTMATVSRFLQFVAGALFAMLFFLVMYYDEGFLQLELISDRSVAWVMTILAVVMGLLRGLASESIEIQTPNKKWEEAKEHLVIFEQEWDENPTHPKTAQALGNLFDLWALVILGELFGIILAPLLLIFRLPSHASNIVRFYAENYHLVEGLGHHEKHVIGRNRTMLDRAKAPTLPIESERAQEMVGSQLHSFELRREDSMDRSTAAFFESMQADSRSVRSERHMEDVRKRETVFQMIP